MQSRAEHAKYHMEDVHRAGGVIGITGRAGSRGLLREVGNVLGMTLPELLAAYDITLTKMMR